VDGLLAVLLGSFVTLVTVVASHNQPARRPFDIGTVVLIWAAAGALVARRRHPVAVLEVVFGATLVYFVVGYANGPIWLALIVAYVTAVLRGHRLAAAITAVMGFAVFPWLDYLIRDGQAPTVAALAGLAAWLLVLLGGAEIVRYRRERAAEAIRMREQEALRRASEERLRIARELHDALGHHLSLINVQSGVALHLHEDLPEQARSSLSAIKEALIELRSVLEILREQDERAPRSPTSTLARLDDLVAQASAAGIEVRTEVEGAARPLPFGVDVAAYRIVQRRSRTSPVTRRVQRRPCASPMGSGISPCRSTTTAGVPRPRVRWGPGRASSVCANA
jgi:signal transduction histidine kinase